MLVKKSDANQFLLMKSKLRFSVRSLLVLTAIVALFAWWLGSPTATTGRFVRAVTDGEYEAAGQMFRVDGANDMLVKWKPIHTVHILEPRITLSDLFRGRRRMHLTVTYAGPNGDVTGYFLLEADHRGIHSINTRPYQDAEFRFQ